MLDSIYVGMSGLLGYSNALRVISNNTANMNTPGFKASAAQFTDLFYDNSQAGRGNGPNYGQLGYGMTSAGVTVNYAAGEIRSTGRLLDAGIDGIGWFVLRQTDGSYTYTRAGQFDIDADGWLINRTDRSRVMTLQNGQLSDVNISGMRTTPGKATSAVTFNGNLSSTATSQNVGNISVYDQTGTLHTLSMTLTNLGASTSGTWLISVTEGGTTVGTGQLAFVNGTPTVATSRFTFAYAPLGGDLTFDFTKDVTSYSGGNFSTITAGGQDGYGPGSETQASFDEVGNLVLGYSNGQSVKVAQLALANFRSTDDILAIGGNQFKSSSASGVSYGKAGDSVFGKLKTSSVEISNVDLSQEFSDLVIMQRGYQASSQVITTANDMLQQLFTMKGGR
ncbi:flagellar biosynthesis protein FlgE [Pandoraea communis]|uniref:Flagellar biosynthesis protein FlgE n=1 Tax=Pandoraea communis TaxID=2508297 RepID=A0A5E4YNZ7_9BURK|nr:flagellar hook-basal body complex protein [Pandoraea communis]VVE50594.1 flagellar biosynthesis protein FlgE [Pandoraea communis]